MKKALFLSHVPLFPEIGGDRLRIVQSLKLLSEIYETDVVYMTNFKDNESIRDNLPAVKSEKGFYSPKLKRYWRALKTVFNDRPFIVNLYHNPHVESYVESVYKDYDVVFCASPATAQYALSLKGIRKVLDMTDSLTMNYRNALADTKGPVRKLRETDMNRMAVYERECKQRFDSVAYISKIDRDYIRTDGEKSFIVGNAVIPQAGKKSEVNAELKHLIFVGKMDYEPNVGAVVFFAKEVMPLLRKRIKDIRFSIVGVSPAPQVRELDSLPGVAVTGFVESLDEWYRNSSLFVAPMLSGSGVQNKILQALSFGCGVVTTPIGREGIEVLDEVMEVVSANPEEWAEKITEIITDPSAIKEKAARAPALVSKEFSMDKIRQQFRDFI